jgi:hypothetical protein
MTKLANRYFRLCSLLLAILAVLMPTTLVHAMPARQSPKQIRIAIMDGGFDGVADEYNVEVEQGQLVEITFVWAHKAYVQDEHIFVIDGYKLETPKIDSGHKEATLRFVADKVGTFAIHCDLECDAHAALQRANLKVKPASGGGGTSAASARLATTLTIKPSMTLVATGDIVDLMTTLRDKNGAPVAKADIQYFVETTFGGVKGKMNIGHVRTDVNGVAFFDYQPALSDTNQKITAQFDISGLYDESAQSVDIQLVGQPLPAYRQAPIGLESLRDLAPYGLMALVLGIWCLFAFVMFQALSVARGARR